MSRLVSLLCKGCLSRRENYSLFDDGERRSCYGKCHHSLCEQCVSLNPEQDCPLCGEPKAFEHKTIDYAASRVYEDLLNRPIDILKDWWNGETADIGRCALCREEGTDLRVCVECEMKLPEDEPFIMPIPNFSPTDSKYLFSVHHYWRLPDFFSRVYCSDCLIDRHDEIEERNIERIKKSFEKRGWPPKPEDLEVHEPKKSQKLKLKDLKNYGEEMKRLTLPIAKRLLWKSFNKMEQKDFCKLRFWRLFRTFEALVYYSRELCRSHGQVIAWLVFVSPSNSEQSKFFTQFKNHGMNESLEETVEKLMNSLGVQLEEIKRIQKKCECTEIYERMHKWKCGNSVDQIFVKMIESVDFEDVSVSGCLLRRDSRLYEEIQQFYKTADEMFHWKLHLIPTVVCWLKSIYSGVFCCLFDDMNRKPYNCRECGNSICAECWKDEIIGCPVCRKLSHDRKEMTVNTEIIELVNFYKKNCVDLYEKWWNSEPVPFCLACYSYSPQLEICAFCELSEEPSSLRCNSDRNADFLFKSVGLQSLPLRIQCSQCPPRLESDWKYENCEKAQLSFRGCNHLRSRFYDRKCSADESTQFNAIALNSIDNFKYAWKLATIDILHQILKSAVEDLNICKLRKMRFLKILRKLKNQTYDFLNLGMFGILENEEEHLEGIQKAINILKFQWAELQGVRREEVERIQKKCECTEIYEKMHKWKFGNSVDQIFVKMVESVDLEDDSVSGCLLRRDSRFYEELQECYKKAEEMSQWKLHLIPTVVCWSKSINSGDLCCLFDDKNRKPYKCRECGNSICAECWKDEIIECPVCRKLSRYRKERSVNTEIIELVNVYKKNCVDLYEKWWNSEPVPFCLVCSSYSTQLEICAFCELSEEYSSLRCNSDRYEDFLFKAVCLRSMPLRIQCSQCPRRLESNWKYRNCEKAQDNSQLSIRGCNHLRRRFYDRECRAEEFTSQDDPFNAIALNSIDNFKYAWKLATIEILHQILKSAVEDLNICKLRKIRFLKILRKLKNQTYDFLNLGMFGILENEEKHLEGIQKTIDVLKFQWVELQGVHENCRCQELLDRVSSEEEEEEQLWELFKTATSFQLDQKLEGCPLEFNHGFKTLLEDDLSLEFHNLWKN